MCSSTGANTISLKSTEIYNVGTYATSLTLRRTLLSKKMCIRTTTVLVPIE